MKHRTVIVGAGLAGLSCAARLHEEGVEVQVFEASDGVGGRVRTDEIDGFLLDRGFQVYLDAYQTAGEFLDLAALELHRFEPGALVWKNGKLWKVMDIFRRPFSLISSALAPVGSVADKLRVAKLRNKILNQSIGKIWQSRSESTESYLRHFGFSDQMIDDFFRGFYGGIFLEDNLSTSSRMFEFTYQMFSKGSATLPAEGMQAIPEQIAARLPKESIHLNSPVKSIERSKLHLADDTIEASNIVLAVDGSNASGLVPGIKDPEWNSTSCLYFSADNPPVSEPLVVLKGDREGLINNLSVPSLVSPSYAPKGKSLVSVSVLGDHRNTGNLTENVTTELIEWFGDEVKQWKHLHTEHIRKSLPIDPPGNEASPPSHDSIHVCGDHTTSGSIEGAIQSGLRVADRILTG